MARPRSDEKRDAIMAAAVKVIASQGLGAPTAVIAKEAGVSNGTFFTYFGMKADLLNQLYVELKMRMAAMTVIDVPGGTDAREQFRYVWNGLLRWGATHPQERRALAHLSVSNEVTAASRRAASEPYMHVESLLDQCRAHGHLRDAPLMFVASLVMSMADVTIGYTTSDPTNAETTAASGFEAVWRVIA